MLIIKIAPDLPIDDVGFWSITICITISSFIWFLTKLYKKVDVTSYLDLYSTAWIAVVTILTTLFDLQEKKAAFVFLLAMYFVLQEVKLLPFSIIFNIIIVVTERNISNRKVDKHEHRSILQSFHR